MLRSLAIALLVCLSLASGAWAQSAAINGQVEGTVTDPSGAAVAGAEVTLRNAETGLVRTQKTDAAGFYRFPLLPLGNYELTVSASGFAQARRTGIVLNAGSNAVIDVALALAATATEVVVTAAPGFPPVVFSAIALFAITNTALLNYIMGSRLAYGMARQGLLPAVLGRLHPRRRTPHWAILALMVIVLTLGLGFDLKPLAKATSVLLMAVFVVFFLAAILLRSGSHLCRLVSF